MKDIKQAKVFGEVSLLYTLHTCLVSQLSLTPASSYIMQHRILFHTEALRSDLPVHVLLSCESRYPGKHSQRYEPASFLHRCSQPPFKFRHSLISEMGH